VRQSSANSSAAAARGSRQNRAERDLPGIRDNRLVAGFIVLEDGRAYAASNFATNAMLRAISPAVDDAALKVWLLAQQSQYVGMGHTCVDLRELAPRYRPVMRAVICRAYERVISEGFENLRPGDDWWASWLRGFHDLVENGCSKRGRRAARELQSAHAWSSPTDKGPTGTGLGRPSVNLLRCYTIGRRTRHVA
jgi:hypothetical protein